MPVTMTEEVAKMLRAPFPAEVVGKLPRVWCKQCRDAAKSGRTCENHQKVKCQACRNNITTAHLHLDYVGHAEVTDRFLAVDPEWSWAPFAFDEHGLPAFDRFGGLWINLTIAGVTRIGYGAAAEGKTGPDAVKETIGDALRNGGLRFGVAIDLWGATYKDNGAGGSGGDEHQDQPTADEWENARPAGRPLSPTREQLIDAGHKAIREAKDTATLAALTERVAQYVKDNAITGDDGASLTAAIKGREVELAASAETVRMIDEQQHKALGALFGEIKLNGADARDDRLAYTSRLVGRKVTSSKELTHAEADALIIKLREQKTARKSGAKASAGA